MSYHVERFGCYVAGPFNSRSQAIAWIAQQRDYRDYEILETGPGVNVDVEAEDGCAKWVACTFGAIVLVLTVAQIIQVLQ